MSKHEELIERLRCFDRVTCNEAADALEAQEREIDELKRSIATDRTRYHVGPTDAELDELIKNANPTQGIRADSRNLSMTSLRKLMREAINKWNTTNGVSSTQSSKCTAADGKTEIFNVPGYPLMVSAVDFNRLFYDTCGHYTLQSNDQLSMKRATVVDCGNLYATIKLHDEAFGTTKIGDIFYGVPDAKV